MKKYVLVIMLISKLSIAQTIDYTKKNKEELIEIIDSKVNEIKVLENKLKRSKMDTDKLTKETSELKQNNSHQLEISKLKKSIQETNAVFLREIFDDKYVKNPYLINTDLGIEDISKRLENSNILIRSISLDETNKSVFIICDQALDFNLNYLKLFEIRKTVLSQKYDSLKVKQAIIDIEALPLLASNSKLDITKKKMREYLKRYLEHNCSLKITLDTYKSRYKESTNSESMKQKYAALEKDVNYKDYPYLVQVIQKIKDSPIEYTHDDLQSCSPNKEEEIKK